MMSTRRCDLTVRVKRQARLPAESRPDHNVELGVLVVGDIKIGDRNKCAIFQLESFHGLVKLICRLLDRLGMFHSPG